MKLINLVILPFALLSTMVFAQPCSVILSASDSLVCSGDNISLDALVNGPALQLQASNTAGNDHRGNMFDIVATNAVTILSFDASPQGNTAIEIYYKVGTWNGFANTPSAWTLIGSAPVTYTGGFVPVDVDVNITIPAGETYAFYVTSNTQAVALNYSNGTNVGNVYSSDANISFLEGGGMEYPFTQETGAVYQPRVWNGMIHYALANQPGTTLTWGNGDTNPTIMDSPLASTEYTASGTVVGCPETMYDTLDVIVSIPVVGIGNVETTVCEGTEMLLYGTGAETYTWDNAVMDSISFNINNTETYTVIGADSVGCTGTDFVTITVNPNPIVLAGSDYNVCEGESTILTGVGAQIYVWNNSIINGLPFEPTATATYIVTGTDHNGCSTIDSIEVTVSSLPIVSAGSDVHICLGEEHTLHGTGTTPVTYTWNNGVINGIAFNPTLTNTYTLTATDTNGCVSTDEMKVFVHNVMASAFSSGSVLSAGTLVDMSAQWVNCSDMTPIIGETSPFFEPVLSGTYAIVVEDNTYGCRDTSNCIEVTVSYLGINDQEDLTLSIYPVPTNSTVTVSSNGTIIDRIELIDLLGKVITSNEVNGFQTTIDLSSYESNTFFVRIYRGENITLSRVIKN